MAAANAGASAPPIGDFEASGAALWARPAFERKASGPFHFQHAFAKDNPGHILDFYDVESEIGRGTFGSVFRLQCRTTGVRRAAKQMPYEKVKDPEKFEREIRIAKQLDHPNLVRLFEIFRSGRYLYLVMELCTGGELFDRITEGGLPEAEAAGYIRQTLAALSYLHANSFAHRDVKPENFMLQSAAPDAGLKLIDFGLACRFSPDEPMHTKAGTAYYVAPEVLLAGGYNELVDVWSVGVVAYILLCGYPPFNGDTDSEVLSRVKDGTVRFDDADWDHVSPSGIRLLRRMLEYSPEYRTSASLALESSWLQSLALKHSDRQQATLSDASTWLGDESPVEESPMADPSPSWSATGSALHSPVAVEVVSRLQDFHLHSKLKRVALTAVAQQLPDEETAALQQIFRDLDTNSDGVLSPEEVRLGLERIYGIDVPEAVEDILRTVDSDGSGCLDYTEFVAAAMDQRLCSQRDLCLAAFRTFDLDGNGRISCEELVNVLGGSAPAAREEGEGHGLPGGSPCHGRVARMIGEVDTNGDGCIDFDEFLSMMAATPEAPGPEAPPAGAQSAPSAAPDAAFAPPLRSGKDPEEQEVSASRPARAACKKHRSTHFVGGA